MFDYQAGEKYKLTLIMVGVAGLMAGMFFSFLLMPTGPAPSAKRKVAYQPYMSHPDVTGRAALPGGAPSVDAPPLTPPGAAQAQGVAYVDRFQAKSLIESWLPYAWDLSAGTAPTNQEKAISFMTPECATAYRSSIWTPEIAKQIEEAGLHSTFQSSNVDVTQNLPDGSVVVKVQGVQTLGVAGGGGRTRQVNLEYMIKQTAEGPRIAGITEAGQGTQM